MVEFIPVNCPFISLGILTACPLFHRGFVPEIRGPLCPLVLLMVSTPSLFVFAAYWGGGG